MKIEAFRKAEDLVYKLKRLEEDIETLSGMGLGKIILRLNDPVPATGSQYGINMEPVSETEHDEERRCVIGEMIEALIKSYKEEQTELMAKLEAL